MAHISLAWVDHSRQNSCASGETGWCEMDLSIGVLEGMGFKKLSPGQDIAGSFARLDVFELQGTHLESQTTLSFESCINDVPFRFGIGNSVNTACRVLTGDDYTEDEERWRNDNTANPPFLLVLFGPVVAQAPADTFFSETSEHIVTYGGFNEARVDLRNQSNRVIPSLLTSLTQSFSSTDRLMHLEPIDSTFTGKSKDGKLIHDLLITMSAKVNTAERLDADTTKERAAYAIEHAKRIDKNFASSFHTASNEKDPLKRFLLFFFCLEQLIHSKFREIDHDSAILEFLSGHARVRLSGLKLLNAHRESWKDLRNRFIWCAMHRWRHLADTDVQMFDQLKSVRDRIAHGKLLEPDSSSVSDLEFFVLKVLGRG